MQRQKILNYNSYVLFFHLANSDIFPKANTVLPGPFPHLLSYFQNFFKNSKKLRNYFVLKENKYLKVYHLLIKKKSLGIGESV
jgi:hypothetical protein